MQAIRFVALAAALGLAVPHPVSANGNAGDYLVAQQARVTGDFESAVHFYTRALENDPHNPQLLEALVLSEIALGHPDRAVPAAQQMWTNGINSQIARMATIADRVKNGDFEAILSEVQAGSGIGPLVDGLLTAWLQVGLGNMAEALVAFDGVAGQKGLDRFALYHKALALGYVGDFSGAEALWTADHKDGPIQMTRRSAMARIEALSQLDRNDDALQLLNALFGRDVDPALAAMREKLEAGERLDYSHVTSVQDGVAEIFYSVAAALQSEASTDYVLLYSRLAEYLRPDHIDALLLSAELLEELDRPELATRTYRRVPLDSPAYHAAELGRADSLRKAGRTDAALEVLEQLAVSHGNLPVVHTTIGDINRQLGQHVKAVAAYDRALALHNADDPAQWFILYARGISQERLGNWPDAEADLRRALELNPEQPQVLNYLGYSLVEKQQNLEEALAMIERAAEARPDSGYIIDSLGWVLYRLGRYQDAVGHMERAAALDPADATVNDHLGDVYWAVDRKLEARFQWSRALSFGPEDQEAERIRRKLKVGLNAVLAEEGQKPLQVARGSE